MTDKYVSIEYDMDAETATKAQEAAEEMGMSLEGFLTVSATEQAIRNGDLDPADMLSAQDMLIAIAEKLDEQGNDPAFVSQMADKLRALSYYATTHLVPVSRP